MIMIMSPANRDSFTSSFPVGMPLVYFSCLIALAGTSCTMLSRSGKSWYPCLVSDLRGGKLLVFPIEFDVSHAFLC